MKNTKALFLHHLTALSNQLTASSLQDNPALWLYQNNARTTLFYLEGMTRALAHFHDKKRFNQLTERFKTLEDGLGQIDYFDAFIKEFSEKPAIPVEVVALLTQQRQAHLAQLNSTLHDDGWIGDAAQRIHKIRNGKSSQKIDWLSDDALIAKLHCLYHDKAVEITESLSQPIVSIEADLHELRRDIRWLSIYPQAFKGYITLTRPRAIIARKFDKYLTDEIVHSPYNVLPSVPDIRSPLQLNVNNFYAMSWFIAALGTLKDQGLRLDALTHAIHITQKISPEAAQTQALTALGSPQASIAEIIQAAEFAMRHVKTDGIFMGLLSASAPKADK